MTSEPPGPPSGGGTTGPTGPTGMGHAVPTGVPDVYRPGGSRVLAVGWWLLTAVLGGDLALRGEPGAGWAVGLALLLTGAAVVHALLWQPEVRVDAGGLELVNVLRRVRLPWSTVEDIDTRWALTVRAEDRRWTSWAAPASGRRVRPVSRRETPWAPPGAEAIAGSRAPGSSAGEAAVLVGTAWQTWKDRRVPAGETGGGERPEVRWNRPVVASLGVTGVVLLATLVVFSLG